MKRFTLALIALLSVVVVFADGPKKQLTKLPTMPAKASMPLRQKLDIKEAPASLTMKKAPAQATPRRGPRKAPSAADLEGVYTWDYLQADKLSTDLDSIETTSYSKKVTITQSETTEGGLTISGMFGNSLEATIDGDYIVIERGQAAGLTYYGAYAVVGVFYYEGDEEHEAGWYSRDIHGKIKDDGSICFEEWIISRLTNGEYAGYSFAYYVSGSTLTPDESLSLVKVPEGVEIVPYVMSYYDPFLEVDATIPVNVAVDGNDVYFQGLGAGANLPKAWVKGTKSGNIVTFPENQYMGEGRNGSTYGFSYGGDGVFTYAPETDIYTAEGYVGVTSGANTENFYNPVLMRVIERAAMPANPAILSLDGDNYNRLDFNVLLKDTDGAPLDASKLSYMIYTDTDGNISQLTFTPTTHYALTEDLTEIPYGFTDNSDFTRDHIYLNDLYSSDWDRIGIQSIYTCGGELNATPIQWFENKEAYAVVKGNTLTFYYDSERATREGWKYSLPYYGNTPGWTGFNNGNGNTTITTATFDESFKNYTGLKNTGRWFYYLKALTTINHFDYLNTANVRDMSGMFLDCSSLVNLDITNLNTDNVTDMSGMFLNCSSLVNLDITNMNTANVTDMAEMFSGCSSLTTIDLSNFDMTNVTNTRWMFKDCTSLTTIYCNADWSLGVVSESGGMFGGCTSLVGAVSYDKSNIGISFANPITGYFTLNYELEPYAVVDGNTLTFYYDRRRVLREGVTYDLPSSAAIPDWTSYNNGEGNTSVTTVTFDESFKNYTGLTSTRSWFYYMRALTTINHFDYLNTANVRDMSNMFNGCSSLTTIDLSNFDMTNVTDTRWMFQNCTNLTTIYCNADWSLGKVSESSEMFGGCTSLVGAVSYDDSNDNDISFANPITGYFTVYELEPYAVVDGNTLTFYYDRRRVLREGVTYDLPSSTGIPDWASYNYGEGSTSVTTVTFDESFKNYTGLKNTGYWFYYMRALTTINHFDYLNTANVRDMSNMFNRCSSLTTIDLSNFDMTNVTDTRRMFKDCSNLTTIYCNADWSLGKVSVSEGMFDGCTSLVGAVSYDKSNIDISFANPITGYFTYELEPYAVVDGNTLTFYYDRRRVLREGMTYDLPSSAAIPDWTSYNNGEGNTTVTTVTFDESFENYTGLTSTRSWFYYMRALTTINYLDYLNTDNVTDMSCMFMGCSSLSSLDITNLNTANVTDMSAMFSGCSSLTALEATCLQTDNVTNMSSMFNGCSNLTFLDVAGLNTANVTNMNDMFCDCQALENLDVSNFITDNVTSMRSMFADCHALTSLDVTNFNTANVTDMYFMFHGCSALTDLDVTNFNTANVTDMSEMFSSCLSLTSLDLSGFNTANVTRMPLMFGYCMKLESLNVANFDMTNVTDTRWMFKDCSNLTTIYCNADWSLGVVTESEGMFDNCPSLQGAVPFSSDNDNDISFANPTNGYFTGAEAYAVVDKDLESLTFYYDFNKSEHESNANKDVFEVVNNGWDKYPDAGRISFVTIDESMENYHGLTTTSKMFKGLYEVRGEIKGLRYLNTEHVTDMSNMFDGCQNLDSLDLSHFNTSQVTDMDYMFYGCSALEELDLSSFNTSKVTRMIAMFSYCMALKSVDLSSFNTSQMGEMGGMFNKCKSLKSLDLTNFNMSNVSDVEAMFYGCSALTTIYCNDDWSKYPLIYNDAELFAGCVKLVGAVPFEDGNDYSDWANPDTGYFTRKLMRGDVNGDSKVTIADVTALVNIILGKTTSYNAAVADINSDTKITIADVTALVNIILGK